MLTVTDRWKILPETERQGIKNFVVQRVLEISKEESTMQSEKLFLNKLNILLVQVLKQVRGLHMSDSQPDFS
jgi:exportin-1